MGPSPLRTRRARPACLARPRALLSDGASSPRLSLSSELRKMVANLGEKLEEEELDEMMEELDPNNSGYVNYHEFVKKVVAKPPPPMM